MRERSRALPQMLVALDFSLTAPCQVVIAGDPQRPDTQALLRIVRDRFIPVKTVLLADGGKSQSRLAQRLPQLATMHPLNGAAAAYVCRGNTCAAPTSDSDKLAALLP